MLKAIGIFLGIMVGILLLTFIIQGESFFLYKFWVPKMENAKREVFENTQSYVESKRQDLVKFRLEYIREKDPVVKEAIKRVIINEFANFDENKLTDYELKLFLHSMKFDQ